MLISPSVEQFSAQMVPETSVTPRPSQFANAYSSTGFDMLGILVRCSLQAPFPNR